MSKFEEHESHIYINGKFLTQDITGVQRFAIEIVKQLCQLSSRFIILAPKNIIHVELAKLLPIKKVGTRGGSLWEQIDLPNFLVSNARPLLLNLANSAPLFYRNQIVTIHDVAFIVNPKWFSRSFVLWYKILIPNLAKRSRAVITVSNFSKSEILKYLKVDSNKVFVVYNSAVKNENHLDKFENIYGRYILFVGSLDPRKNLKTLILAFRNAGVPGLKLLIVGNFNKNFSDSELSFDSEVIRVGKVDDPTLTSLYSNAVAFVYPSLYEGFGIPPIEAMAQGCPVISSSSSSLPEVCADAALYFDPNNVNEIEQSIKKIVVSDELRSSLINKGFHRIEEFSWIKSAQNLYNILDELNVSEEDSK